jgi:hypothetical protein
MVLNAGREPSQSEEFYGKLRTATGLLLIGIGVLIALWAFVNVYRVFTNPDEMAVFGKIVPQSPELRELDIEGDKIVLPVGLFSFMAYFIGCLLLLIAGMIGGAFITGGVGLLQPAVMRLDRRMRAETLSLRSKIEQLGELIKKEERES